MNNKDLLKLFDKIQEDKKQTVPEIKEERILIVDGLNLFLRNFAVLNYVNTQGFHIGGLGGFLRSLGALTKTVRPTSIYIVFDGVASSINRKNLIPGYKSGRSNTRVNSNIFEDKNEEDDAKADQISRLIQYLQCLPVKIISLDKVEADDVIAFISTELAQKTFIASTDKDFIQLVNEKITVYGAIEKEFWTPKTVKEKYKLNPNNFIIYKTLMGDNSDKIPGVKGLGDKKIQKLFPELFNDEKLTLEDIFKICESKYKDHIIYSRTIFGFDDLKTNYKVMDLSNPMLDESEKNIILDQTKEAAYKLNIAAFTKLYNEDGLGNVLKNLDYWLRDNWVTIDAYNRSKLYL